MSHSSRAQSRPDDAGDGARTDLTSVHAEPKFDHGLQDQISRERDLEIASRVSEYAQAKTKANISDTQAKRWQKLAAKDDARRF